MSLEDANTAFSEGKYEQAVDLYKAAMGSLPEEDHHLVHSNIGASLQNLGKPAEAIEAFDAALQLDPTHAQSFHNKGVSFTALGKHDHALQAFEAAVSAHQLKHKNDAESTPFFAALCGRAEALANLQRFDESVGAATTAYAAAANDTEEVTALSDRAFALLKIATRRGGEAHWLVYLFAGLFLFRYAFL